MTLEVRDAVQFAILRAPNYVYECICIICEHAGN